VSTQNLLVGRDGVTRLTDFGVAKSDISSVITDQGYVQGKLAYMAPEYLRRASVDRTLDVYAMGVTLFTALTGRHPWDGKNQVDTLQSIVSTGVPPLSSVNDTVPPRVASAVDRACDMDPRRRFQTALDMLEALEAASKEAGCLARHLEVAAYLERAVGPELARRRQSLKAQRDPFELASEATHEEPAAQESDSEFMRQLEVEAKERRRSSLRVALYAALALAVIAAALGTLLTRSDLDPEQAPSSPAAIEERERLDPADNAGVAPALPGAPGTEAMRGNGGDAPAPPLPGAQRGAAGSGTSGAPAASAGKQPASRPRREGRGKLNQITTANPYRQVP
jgi:serine/threonine-protein kinase